MTSHVERVYDGFFAIDRHHLDHPDFPQPLVREVFVRGPAACVLVFDPVLDSVLLVEELRIGNHAAGFQGAAAVSLGPIAGMVEPGQSPAETALREAVEEAGITIDEGELFGPVSTFPSPGGSSEILHHFVALGDLSQVQDGARFGLATEGESTRVRILGRHALNAVLLGESPVPANGLAVTCAFYLQSLLERGRIPGVRI